MTSNHGIFRIECEDCILVTDIRYPVTADKDIIFKKIEELAESLGLKAEIKNNMDPVYKDKDSEEIKVLTKIWTRHMPDFTGYKEEYSHIYDRPVAIGGGTYARHMRNTIAFGIQTPWSEDQCHQVNESLSLNDFENLIDVIKDACQINLLMVTMLPMGYDVVTTPDNELEA